MPMVLRTKHCSILRLPIFLDAKGVYIRILRYVLHLSDHVCVCIFNVQLNVLCVLCHANAHGCPHYWYSLLYMCVRKITSDLRASHSNSIVRANVKRALVVKL